MDSNLLFIVLVVFTPGRYALGMPPVCLARKSLNTKRLSPNSRSKSLAESFRGWDWLFRFWDARCNTATQSEYVAVFGKMIIAGSPKNNGYVSALDRGG